MLDEVIAFAIVMSVFEFVILVMVPPRARLRLLGNDTLKFLMHIGFLLVNLIVHWGTVVGTMSSTLSFITSLFVVALACKLFGFIKNDRHYHVGWVKYSIEEIK